MANQIEAPKIVKYVVTGPNDDEISSPKVVMYLLLEPGEIVAGDTTRQGHIHSQIISRG